MKIFDLLRTSTFQLALLYMILFAASVFVLLGFIYWATAGYMSDQMDETIEAETVGLAEQYRRQGVNGLISVINERISRDTEGKSVYLFTAQDQIRLAGNLLSWPDKPVSQEGWVNFVVNESNDRVKPHLIRARVYIVPGGLRLLVGRDVHELMQVKQLIERALNWGMGITLGLALLGGLMVSRTTARRIETINLTSQKIMNGSLSERMPTRGTGDDFDQLADNLNQMLDRIEQLMEGVRHVSDNIAHDLRTPLTRLRNHLEQTLLTVDSDEEKEMVASAVAEADQMLVTFNALLRIARLEGSGKLSQPVAVDLSRIVQDAIELYEVVAEDKEQTLDCQIPEGVCCQGDRDLLFQVVSNLIDNAIKYSPPNSKISIQLRALEQRAELVVADQGVGVPDEEKEKIFQRFYRVAKSRSAPGNGLGLSLVAAIIKLHAGEIRLLDNEPGLQVCVSLPKGNHRPQEEARLALPAAGN